MRARPNVVVVTGASGGFGDLTARALAEAGHIVCAGAPADTTRAAEYDAPYGRLRDTMTGP
ncbi:hypothetical protein OHB54_45180 [Streptomyces sp. NBC_01007]|nr:hypothetical protein OHB54_45180 [Streptomyces sp. NBC_01007]